MKFNKDQVEYLNKYVNEIVGCKPIETKTGSEFIPVQPTIKKLIKTTIALFDELDELKNQLMDLRDEAICPNCGDGYETLNEANRCCR